VNVADGTGQGRGTVYEPAYFAQFAPRNALDMVARIPGFVITEERGSARGLGQASQNVLINGERLSSKSDSARDQLQRIPANDVVRIEIVDGTVLDIPGLTGQVANVVIQRAGSSGQFRYTTGFRAHNTKAQLYGGEISLRTMPYLETTRRFTMARIGELPSALPAPVLPHADIGALRTLLGAALAIAALAAKLKAVPEGDGTMLDNTMIVYTSDNAARHHSFGVDWPMFVLGNIGGKLKSNGHILLSLVRTRHVGHIRDVRRLVVAPPGADSSLSSSEATV
jgi:hypothetical protein